MSEIGSDTISNLLLANFISFLHILVVLFVILAPFSNILYILILHVSFAACLLLHWRNNSDICSLSILESKLRGLDYTETYMHRLISPIYTVSESQLSKWCYIITIITMSISIYKIYNSPKTYEIIECIRKVNSLDISIREKWSKYKDCLLIAFLPN